MNTPLKRSAVVLLVEDDPVLGPVTMDMLAECGHAPTLAVTYEQAYELLSAPHRIEVVILDLQLGAQRGDTLIHALRSTGACLPRLVLLSAQPMPDLVLAAKSVGAEAFLQKPCSGQRIMEAISLAMA